MRKTAGALLLVGAMTLAGCGDGEQEASAVCVDRDGNRVDDSRCGSGDDGMNGFLWYYILSSLNQPRMGSQVVHNHYYSDPSTNRYAGFTKPKSAPIYKGVPKAGFTPKAGSSFRSKSYVQKPASGYKAPAPAPRVGGGGFNKAPNPAPRIGKR